MSPSSNNNLFVEYQKNPFPNFFAKGTEARTIEEEEEEEENGWLIVHVVQG